MVTGFEIAQQDILGGQSTSERETVGRPFEAGDALLVGMAGGIAGTRVLVTKAGFTDAVLGECR